ncbi:hypothetical protein Tco_1156577 [Tanacetum coccineum]
MDTATCHIEVGQCKRNCPAYLAELIKKKKQVGTASSSDVFIIELCSFPTKSWVYDTSCVGIDVMNSGNTIHNGQYGLGPGRLPPGCRSVGAVYMCKPEVLLILIIQESLQASKDPFMVLSKHQDSGTKDLMRKSKGLDFPQTLDAAIHVYIKRPSGLEEFQAKYHCNVSNRSAIHSWSEAAMEAVWIRNLFGLALSNRKLTQHARGMGLRPARKRGRDAFEMENEGTEEQEQESDNDFDEVIDASVVEEVSSVRSKKKKKENMRRDNPLVKSLNLLEYVQVHILKYLRNTKDMFLVYGGNPEAELRVECYCDAGFKTDRYDIKSQTKYVFVLNGGAVDWKSSKQSNTTMSATDVEYMITLKLSMFLVAST